MCVTAAKPAAEQMDDMNFGWHIVKHVKSNAIVVVKDGRTLGVGAGQMNRIGSAEIALKQAHAAGVTEGLVLASDGFFPFDDCVTLAAEYGVTAIVQPGGSVRDEDSIRKADEKGIAMVFTGAVSYTHLHSVPGAEKQFWMMMGDFNARSSRDNWFYKYPAGDTRFLVHDYILRHTPYVDVIAGKYPGEMCIRDRPWNLSAWRVSPRRKPPSPALRP